MNATLDYSVLNKRLSDLAGALFGRGSGDGEVQQALKTETGQLAGRIGDVIGPKTKARATRRATGAVFKTVAILPSELNLDEPGVQHPDWTWLYASKGALVGVKNSDDHTGLEGQSAMDFFRGEQGKNLPPKKARIQVGQRGKQRIIQIQKGMVTRTAANSIQSSIMGKMGQLGAAFYNVAIRYVPRKKVTSFQASRMPAAERAGKSRVDEQGMNTPEPAITFTVFGKGLENNPNLDAKIQRVIDGTGRILQAKLSKLARGAKYVFETGQVYFEKTEDTL